MDAFGALSIDAFGGRDSEDEHSAASNEEWNHAHGFDNRGDPQDDDETEEEGDGDDDDDDWGAGGGGAAAGGQWADPALQGRGAGQTVNSNTYPPPPAFASKHCPPLGMPLLPESCNCGGGVGGCDTRGSLQDFFEDEADKAGKLGRNSTGRNGVRRAAVSWPTAG